MVLVINYVSFIQIILHVSASDNLNLIFFSDLLTFHFELQLKTNFQLVYIFFSKRRFSLFIAELTENNYFYLFYGIIKAVRSSIYHNSKKYYSVVIVNYHYFIANRFFP